MSNDKIVSFSDPAFRDELTDLVRDGAQRIMRRAVAAELKAFLDDHATAYDATGRQAVVRNGYQPARDVLTGIGPVTVRVPKTRDRLGEGRCFRSALLPPYLKKARRLEAVLPWLSLLRHLRGEISQSGRLTGQGSRGVADLLRFPGRALATPADDQSDRIDVRHHRCVRQRPGTV